jgi:hypothetical protein
VARTMLAAVLTRGDSAAPIGEGHDAGVVKVENRRERMAEVAAREGAILIGVSTELTCSFLGLVNLSTALSDSNRCWPESVG